MPALFTTPNMLVCPFKIGIFVTYVCLCVYVIALIV